MKKLSKKTLIGSILAITVCVASMITAVFAWYWDGIPWARGAKITTTPTEPKLTGKTRVVTDVYPELPIESRTFRVTYTVTNTGPLDQTFVVKIETILTDGALHPNAEGRSMLDDITYSTLGLNEDVGDVALKNASNHFITVPAGQSIEFTITYVFENWGREDKQNYSQGDKVVVSVVVRLPNDQNA